MPKKTTTKKTTKRPAKKTVAKKTTAKKVDKRTENIYFWGGLAIALCAAGAFMVLAFGIGSMIR